MGVLRSLVRSGSSLATPEKWVVDWFKGGVETAAGVPVDEQSALTFSSFYAGVRVIAEDVASLPLPTYERLQPRGKRRAPDHPVYELLHDQPNEYMTSMQFREALQGHALTWGHGVAEIERNASGRPIALWPLRPDRLTTKVVRPRSARAGRMVVVHEYHDEANGIHTRLLDDEVLRVTGFGFDGVHAYSPVALARNAIGLGLATEAYGASFFRNGSKPGGVLRHPNELSEGARKRMKADWEQLHRGLDNAQRIAILEEGVEWQQLGIPPEDAQFLETRKFQRTEIAGILRIAPHKIADLERSTHNNIEHENIDHVVSTIRPWCVRWEQAIRRRLFSEQERRQYFAEHVIDGLLRGDLKSRYEAYAIGRQWGWRSANDILELENENPIEGGDLYMVPLNMVPVSQLGDEGATPRALAEIIQKIYLGTDRVITSEEAREILNRAGADLDLPGPDFTKEEPDDGPPPPDPT